MDEWINVGSALIGALVGGIATYLSEIHFRKKDENQKIKHYATILYYDLKSIAKYLETERGLVNIRYSEGWQDIVAECLFLKDDEIQYLYEIYDNVYNFNFDFTQRINNGKLFIKEDIVEYNVLQENIFDTSKGYVGINIKNKKYMDILNKIESPDKLKRIN